MRVGWVTRTWLGSRAACARTIARATSSARTPATTTIYGRTAPNWSGHFVPGSVIRTRKKAGNDGSSAAPPATATTRSTTITGSERPMVCRQSRRFFVDLSATTWDPWLPRGRPSASLEGTESFLKTYTARKIATRR